MAHFPAFNGRADALMKQIIAWDLLNYGIADITAEEIQASMDSDGVISEAMHDRIEEAQRWRGNVWAAGSSQTGGLSSLSDLFSGARRHKGVTGNFPARRNLS